MPERLTPEERAVIAHLHREVEAHEHDPSISLFHGNCYTCGISPCHTILLLDYLDAVEAERDALVKELNSTSKIMDAALDAALAEGKALSAALLERARPCPACGASIEDGDEDV